MQINECEVRWNNGYWKIFDTKEYKDLAIFGTFEELAEVLFES